MSVLDELGEDHVRRTDRTKGIHISGTGYELSCASLGDIPETGKGSKPFPDSSHMVTMSRHTYASAQQSGIPRRLLVSPHLAPPNQKSMIKCSEVRQAVDQGTTIFPGKYKRHQTAQQAIGSGTNNPD